MAATPIASVSKEMRGQKNHPKIYSINKKAQTRPFISGLNLLQTKKHTIIYNLNLSANKKKNEKK